MNIVINMFKQCLFLITLLISSVLYADDKTYYLDRQNGEMLKYNDDQLVFNLNVNAKHTDNYLFEESSTKSTNYYELAPNIKTQYHNDNQMLQLGLWATSRKVNDFTEDDTTDSYGLGKYHYKFMHNQSVILSAAFFDYYLERGTGLSKGKGPELTERDHRESNFINIAHQIGNEDSNAILMTMIGRRNNEYTNRPEATAGLNLYANYLLMDFQYRYSDSTYVTSKLSYEDVVHDESIQQDRAIKSLLVGAKWHKNDYTHLSVSLGTVLLDFTDGALDNKQDFKWDIRFRWSPLEQIELSTFSYRSVDENRQIENSYLITDKYGLNVSYKISDRVEFYLQNSFDRLEYYFEDGNKTEDFLLSDFSVRYKFKQNMSFSFTYQYQQSESVTRQTDFERNTFGVGFSFVI